MKGGTLRRAVRAVCAELPAGATGVRLSRPQDASLPQCRTDLTEDAHTHLYACARLPAQVRERAAAARDAARRLVKKSRELSDQADVLIREAEAATAALRETMRRATG